MQARTIKDVRAVARIVLAAEPLLMELSEREWHSKVREEAVKECGARCLRWLRPVVEAVLTVIEIAGGHGSDQLR
jgi:hypothetical protein